MNYYVPARCHGSAAPFESYVLSYDGMPEFIFEVIDTALVGALARQELKRVDSPENADVRVHVMLELIDRNPLPLTPERRNPFDETRGRAAQDSMGESVASNELNRFVTHLMLHVTDLRSGKLIWTGAVDRAHAIQGGETFHDERAVLLISTTFDEMFVGLTTPCE